MMRVKQGEVEAFRVLYERYKKPLMSFAYTFFEERHRAEDVVQDVFLRAYRARETWEPSARVSTWLWTIARNTSIDYLRRGGREDLADRLGNEASESSVDHRVDWTERLESPLPDAEAQLLENAERARFEECLSKLAPKQREILMLRTQGELSYEEIARVAEASLQAVKSILFRAKQSLMNCLGLAPQEGGIG